jgi:hypothetical protein
VWFVPQENIVTPNSGFTTEIHINTGSQSLYAYTFNIHYDFSVIETIDVVEGEDGFISSVNTNTSGLFMVSGQDPSGTGSGEDLHILTINLTPNTTGNITVEIKITQFTTSNNRVSITGDIDITLYPYVDCSIAPLWYPDTLYVSGMIVVYNFNLYENNRDSIGEDPGVNSGENGVWTYIGPCDPSIPITTPTPTPTAPPTAVPTAPPAFELKKINLFTTVTYSDSLPRGFRLFIKEAPVFEKKPLISENGDFIIDPYPFNYNPRPGSMRCEPRDKNVVPDYTFSIEIWIDAGIQELDTYDFTMSFNPDVVKVNTTKANTTDGVEGILNEFNIIDVTIDENIGSLAVSGSKISSTTGFISNLHIVTIHWRAVNTGTTTLEFTSINLSDGTNVIGEPIGIKGDVTVLDILFGDLNSDGSIDILDALLTAQYYVGLNPPGFIPIAADVNCDEKIDIIDALIIARYYVGLISGFCQ